jgi:nitroreductase
MVAATRVFDATAEALRRPGSPGPRDDRELVRLATLAASSHNTQPWRFHLAEDAITIHPDRSRRCPVVDPDDAHLYRSLGCAAENLVHAASLQKLAAEVRFDAEVDGVIVRFEEQDDLAPSALSRALTTRQCTRTAYDGTTVDTTTVATLTRSGSVGSASTVLVTDEQGVEAIAALVERGDLAQLTDEAFRRELVAWIRFGPRSALRTGDGLAGRTSRQPALPTGLGQLLAPVLIAAGTQARKDRALLRSSAGIAIVVTPGDDREDWVAAGRAVERFALQADLLGIRTAFLNQPIEQPALRDELRTLLAEPGYPQLLVRFGHGRRAPYGLRRPVEDVIAS